MTTVCLSILYWIICSIFSSCRLINVKNSCPKLSLKVIVSVDKPHLLWTDIIHCGLARYSVARYSVNRKLCMNVINTILIYRSDWLTLALWLPNQALVWDRTRRWMELKYQLYLHWQLYLVLYLLVVVTPGVTWLRRPSKSLLKARKAAELYQRQVYPIELGT